MAQSQTQPRCSVSRLSYGNTAGFSSSSYTNIYRDARHLRQFCFSKWALPFAPNRVSSNPRLKEARGSQMAVRHRGSSYCRHCQVGLVQRMAHTLLHRRRFLSHLSIESFYSQPLPWDYSQLGNKHQTCSVSSICFHVRCSTIQEGCPMDGKKRNDGKISCSSEEEREISPGRHTPPPILLPRICWAKFQISPTFLHARIQNAHGAGSAQVSYL